MSIPVASRSSAASAGYSARLRNPSDSIGPGPSASVCGATIPAAALDASAPGIPRSTPVTFTPRCARRSPTADPMTPPPPRPQDPAADDQDLRLGVHDCHLTFFRASRAFPCLLDAVIRLLGQR